MPIATGVAKQLRFKKETTWGLLAGTSGGQLLRRVTSDVDLSKDTYQSQEIRADYQIADYRHGLRKVAGSIKGELSPGTYAAFVQSGLRRDFTTVAAVTGASITIAGSGPTYTVTRAAGSFLTDGFKVGMTFRLTAGSFNAANINKNLFIVTLTATVATVIPVNGVALVAEGPIASATASPTGKVTFTPATGHTNDSYTIEHWFADIAQSEQFSGCRVGGIDFDLPPSGIATISSMFMGKDVTTGTVAYFTAPTAATTAGVLAAVNGVLRVAGVTVAIVTGLSIKYDGGMSVGAVVGSNFTPDVFPGRVNVSGQLSAYFETAALRDLFLNETTFAISAVFSTGSSATADIIGFTLPACKAGGATKSDGEQGLQLTMPFQALLNSAGGAGTDSEATTLWIQDSQAA
jgi:hypothetical protein